MNDLVPFADIERMAAVMGRGKMFGKTPEELLPLMLIAQAENKHPAIAAQEYDVIQGRPAINARSAQARFQSSGGTVEWVERTDQRACAKFSHPRGGNFEVAWDMKRAAQAGLAGKEMWKKYPAQMLASRVVSEGVRAVYPACLSGMYTSEEVQDFDNPAPRRPAGKAAPKTAEKATEKPAEDQTIVIGIPLDENNPMTKDTPEFLKARAGILAERLGLTDDSKREIWKQYQGDLKQIVAGLEEMIRASFEQPSLEENS